MRTLSRIYIVCLLFLAIGCQKEQKENKKDSSFQSNVHYAKGFDIVDDQGVKKLIIHKPYQNPERSLEYILSTKTNLKNHEIKVPVERIVVSSTSHIPMLELLHKEANLVGFPNTKFVSSKKTRKLIDEEKVTEIGQEQNINTESLLELTPDLVVGFALSGNDKVYSGIEKLGVPMIYNGDWLEETPLGRAEWIKFFGVLLGKEKEADSIFRHIESEYLNAKKIASTSKKQPTVLAGSMYRDVWYVPAGESFKAAFFKDANLNYLWSETEGTGSLSLSFESILEKGINADFWIGCGLFTSKKDMLSANKNYDKFTSFNSGKIFNSSLKTGETGGMVYFELSPVRPDLVLKDMIKITNPDLLPNYTLTFFDPVQ